MTWWSDKRFFVVLALVSGLYGCKPEIGDECSVSTDCSNAGDRLCDTTQPGGYCTIFNCEPGTCPEEAVCIAFKNSPSQLCPDPQLGDRLRRTFCLRSCGGDDDCRSGYKCIDLAKDNPWKASVAEYGASGKVCIVPFSGVPASGDITDICAPAQGCSASSCAGCCDGQGLCRAGTEATACGSAGGACTSCGAGACAPLVGTLGGSCGGPADAGSDVGSDAPPPDAALDASDAADVGVDADAGPSDAATDS
ncbi:MAG: hypothetical protein R3B13_38445 [Polyangiaceae bacterium]